MSGVTIASIVGVNVCSAPSAAVSSRASGNSTEFRNATAGSPLANSFLGLRHPLEALQVRERLRTAQDLGVPQRHEELLGALETPHSDGARADSLQDVGIRARAGGEVVLAGEADGLVVVC